MTRALGDEQRAQRLGIGREIIGVERHAIRCSALLTHLQSFGCVRRRRESPCRRLLRRLRDSDLYLAHARPIEGKPYLVENAYRYAGREPA